MNVDISKVKTDITMLIDLVNHGKRVTIVQNNNPVADLVKCSDKRLRRLGLLKGKIKIPEDFTSENKEINNIFYGRS
jgi:antitoxin (DNA-binding transcriptional repressor) of toxin-antitoxin stability system